jgi:hypothetical protein
MRKQENHPIIDAQSYRSDAACEAVGGKWQDCRRKGTLGKGLITQKQYRMKLGIELFAVSKPVLIARMETTGA